MVVFAYIADYFRTKREQLELLKQKTDAELGMLKAQINPHFLFNCLNLVYSSAFREKADETAETVQKLSSILRFSVEESKREQTSIEKELDFIEKYTSLQVARLPKREHIRTQIHIESDETPAVIVPLLLVPFIENAFQYAVSTEQPTFIEIGLTVIKKKLHLQIRNSIPNKSNSFKKGTGTGIENTKKRLNLSYTNRHELKIDHQKDTFSVDLKISL
jgi:sensor histidine kinase YesM